MPIYSTECKSCHRIGQMFRKIIDRDKTDNCTMCGGEQTRIVDKARVSVDYAAYDCPITGNRIEGRRQHEENLARHGCRVLEPGETDAFKRAKKAEEDAFDDSIGEAAARTVAGWPSEKQEALATAFDNGLDVSLSRA